MQKTIKLHRQYKQNHKSLFSGLLPHPGRKRSGPILTTLERAWGKRECNLTNNETGRHRGPQQKLRSGHRASSWHRRAMCRHSYFCLLDVPISVMHVIFSSSSVVSCAFPALCAYSTFGHHPHPPGYPCAKLSFCRTLHCWASPWRNIAYSFNHSLTHSLSHSHPAHLMVREPKLSLWNKMHVCTKRCGCAISTTTIHRLQVLLLTRNCLRQATYTRASVTK